MLSSFCSHSKKEFIFNEKPAGAGFKLHARSEEGSTCKLELLLKNAHLPRNANLLGKTRLSVKIESDLLVQKKVTGGMKTFH